MAEPCYFCGAPATSREHIPPACLFPEQKDLPDGVDYRKNLITVPSCDAHNSRKSTDDEYLQLVLIRGYFNNKASRDHFNSKIIRALTRRPAILAALYADPTPVTVDGEPTVSVDINRARFNAAIERVCQGLCVFALGERWPKQIEIHTPLLVLQNHPDTDRVNELVTGLIGAVIGCLEKTDRRGDNPDIFWYQISADRGKDRLLCRMVFYGGFEVLAVSHPRLRRDMD